MPNTRHCTRCDAVLAPFGAEALCPKCMAGEAVAGTSVRYFGDCVLINEIATGGMGVVYKARQRSLDRLVALKLIVSGELAGEEAIRRFHIEAEAAAALSHPNIVPIYEIGEHQGQHYFTMEFVDGKSLSASLPNYARDLMGAVGLVATVARAVHYAHERGVLHRDLKPQNILIDSRGQPRVTDFGLARQLGRDVSLTESGKVMGTPQYMSPEQVLGKSREMTTAVDVWGLGVILYQLLTSQLPFTGSSHHEIFRQILDEEPRRPRLINSDVSRDLETICRRCLEKDHQQRGSAGDLARRLECWLKGEAIDIEHYSYWELAVKWVRRNKLTFVAASAVSASLLVGTAVSVWQAIRAEKQRLSAVVNQRETKAVLDFFDDKVLAAARPQHHEGGMGPDVTVRQAVESAEPQIAVLFSNRPNAEAAIRSAVGRTYHYLGNYTGAIQQLEMAFSRRPISNGRATGDEIAALLNLAESYIAAGRARDALAALASIKQRVQPLSLARRFDTIKAQALVLSGKPSEAADLLKSLPNSWILRSGLVMTIDLNEIGLTAEAITIGKTNIAYPLSRENSQLLKSSIWSLKLFGYKDLNSSRVTFSDLQLVAKALQLRGKWQNSIRLYESAVALGKQRLGLTNAYTVFCMISLADCYTKYHQIQKSANLLEELVAVARDAEEDTELARNLSVFTPGKLRAAFNYKLASAYESLGRAEEAIRLFKDVAEAQIPALSVEPEQAVSYLVTFGAAEMEYGRVLHAIALLELALDFSKTSGLENNVETNHALAKLSEAYSKVGQTNEAVEMCQKALARTEALLGAAHPETLRIKNQLLDLRNRAPGSVLMHQSPDLDRLGQPGGQ